MIYTEFRTWWAGAKHRSKMVFIGALGFIYFSVICGIVSLLYYVIRQVNAFCRREITAACIVCTIILVMSFGWLFTFVKEREGRVIAEHVADSLAYDLSKYTQMHDTSIHIVEPEDTLGIR